MTTRTQEIFNKKLLAALNEFDGELLVDEAVMSLVTLAYQLAVEQAPSAEEGVDLIYDILDSIAEMGDEVDLSDEDLDEDDEDCDECDE